MVIVSLLVVAIVGQQRGDWDLLKVQAGKVVKLFLRVESISQPILTESTERGLGSTEGPSRKGSEALP